MLMGISTRKVMIQEKDPVFNLALNLPYNFFNCPTLH